MTTRKKTLSKWTWTNSLLFTLLICNLAAIAWYFWSLPEQNWDHSKKVIGTLASWSVSVLTFFGIRHTVAKNITVTAFLSMLPARLVIILVSVALWLFCLPFHSLTITVLDGRLPLEGATVRLDGSISRRYGATDALGRIHLGGLAAAEHNMVVEKSDYEPAQAKASFADVLAWRADHAISLTRAMGTLDISSDPSGAVIFLDGDHRNSVGTTPKSVPVSSGKHAVLVEMQGYGSSSWEGAFVKDRQTAKLKITLSAKRYPVTVWSEPDNLPIIVDGRRMGTTPATIMLTAGQHDIEAPLTEGKLRDTINVPRNGVVVLRSP